MPSRWSRYFCQSSAICMYSSGLSVRIRVFNESNHTNRPATFLTFLDGNGEDALEPLRGAAIRPGHRVSFGFLLFFLFDRWLRNDVFPKLAV